MSKPRGDCKRRRRFRKYAIQRFPYCQWCNVSLTLETSTTDHRKSKAKKGKDCRVNFVLACFPCNQKKGDQDWGLPKFGPTNWKNERAAQTRTT